MDRIKNYMLGTACLIILFGAVHLVSPLQADPVARDVNIVNTPVPVVVENGDETMVITLADDLTTAAVTEFDAVDTSGFRFVSFLAKGNFVGEQLQFRFLSESER